MLERRHVLEAPTGTPLKHTGRFKEWTCPNPKFQHHPSVTEHGPIVSF